MPESEVPAAGCKHLHLEELLLRGGQRTPTPSPTGGNHCSNSCHLFTQRNTDSRQSLLPCPSPQQLEPGWRQAWRQPHCPGKLGPPTGLRTKIRGTWGSVLRHPLLPRPLQLGLGWGTWAGDPDGPGHQRSQQFCSGGWPEGVLGKQRGRERVFCWLTFHSCASMPIPIETPLVLDTLPDAGDTAVAHTPFHLHAEIPNESSLLDPRHHSECSE